MSDRPKITGDPILDEYVKVEDINLGPDNLEPIEKLSRAFKLWWSMVDKPKSEDRVKRLVNLRNTQLSLLSSVIKLKSLNKRLADLQREVTRLVENELRILHNLPIFVKRFAAGFHNQILEIQDQMNNVEGVEDLQEVVAHLDLLNALKNRQEQIDYLIEEHAGVAAKQLFEEHRAKCEEAYAKRKRRRKAAEEES